MTLTYDRTTSVVASLRQAIDEAPSSAKPSIHQLVHAMLDGKIKRVREVVSKHFAELSNDSWLETIIEQLRCNGEGRLAAAILAAKDHLTSCQLAFILTGQTCSDDFWVKGRSCIGCATISLEPICRANHCAASTVPFSRGN